MSSDNLFGVEPPKDAEGNVIPLDTKVLYLKDGEAFRVDNFKYSVNIKEWFASGTEDGVGRYMEKTDCLLTAPPDSWEKLIGDLRRAVTGSDYSPECYYLDPGNEGCECCPGKHEQCSKYMLTDIANRIERLMGARND